MDIINIINRLKFYRHWALRNGYKHLFLNFLRVTDMYTLLNDLCEKFNMKQDIDYFFSKPVRRNRLFTDKYLGRMTNDWLNRKGINYEFYLKGLFNER